jgi:glycosyltransferase involved in cell wall biosynthesis
MQNSLVSVVVPMYNTELYIGECLQSLLDQTYKPLEIIVVNNGSTDGSSEVVLGVGRSEIIRLINQEGSGGPSSPRNHALRLAKGDLIFFFDSDDIALPEKIELTVDALTRADDDVLMAITDFSVQDVDNSCRQSESYLAGFDAIGGLLENWRGNGSLRLSGESAFNLLLGGNFVGTSSVAIKKTVLDKIGGFDETLGNSEDYDLWLRVVREGGMVIVDKVLHKYRIRSQGISRQSDRELSPCRIEVLRRQFEHKLTIEQKSRVRMRIADNYFGVAWEAKKNKDFGVAIQNYVHTLKYRIDFKGVRGLAAALIGGLLSCLGSWLRLRTG